LTVPFGVCGALEITLVALARRGDIALDVRRFLVAGVRLHRELLHDRRVDAVDQDAQHEQHAEADGRQLRALEPHTGQYGDSDEDRHPEQDRLGRQGRVDVGVGRAGDLAAIGEDDAVAVEPVRQRLQHDEDEHQDGEVPASRHGDLRPGRLDPDRPEQVVHGSR